MKTRFVPALLLALALAGCDRKAATPSNIESGLNHYLSRLEPCSSYTASSFPITLPTTQVRADLDALAGAGLISKGAGVPTPQGAPQYRYDLTDAGKRSAYAGEHPIHAGQPMLFCFGRIRVKEVINFTEPADQDGVHMTHVKYSVELTDVPSWANDPAIAKAFSNLNPVSFLNAPPREEAMALTHEGWRTSQDE